MSFWGKAEWDKRGKAEKVIEPWDAEKVEEAGCRLSVGPEFYTNKGEGGSIRQLDDDESFVVAPGEFVFVLTEETLRIPRDCIGFVSARATTKFRGLVNVSGFQVDPGYVGRFIFAMFNAGPTNIHLRRGDDIFSIWISDLNSKVSAKFQGTDTIPNGLQKIPTKIINGISSKALTAYQVNESVKSVQDDLAAVKQNVLYLKIAMVIALTILLFAVGPLLRDQVTGFLSTNKTESVTTGNAPSDEK